MREGAALTKEKDQIWNHGWGPLASKSWAAVILWEASHLTVKWLCTILFALCYPDKKRY